MLPKKNRLKKGFSSTLRFGKKVNGKYVVVVYKPHQEQYPRFGILVTKKVGSAVVRNKIKRQIRSIIKNEILSKGLQMDLVIIPSKFVENWKRISFDALQKDILNIVNTI